MVSGTTEAGTVACAVLVYDSTGTTLQGMETCAVTAQTAGNVATTTPANAEYYVVQKGDFLSSIARKNGISLTQLAALNPEAMKQKYIYAGQKIRVK